MKVVLTFALIALTATLQAKISTQTSSDLVVLKFTWSKYVTGSGLVRPVQADPAPGPIVINRDPVRDPNYQGPAATPTQRRAELAALERDAAISSNRSSSFYAYRIQVKNAGATPIKSFVWAFEDPAEMPESPGRQFLCAVKIKANETKGVETLSTQAPSRVVDAGKAGDKTETAVLTAVINRIEYADGSTWQRSGWDSSILSQGAPRKDGAKCVRL
ncbi:MAG: hypothetical protein ABR568_12605 [Pyrinomonadaceae bacterium]